MGRVVAGRTSGIKAVGMMEVAREGRPLASYAPGFL